MAVVDNNIMLLFTLKIYTHISYYPVCFFSNCDNVQILILILLGMYSLIEKSLPNLIYIHIFCNVPRHYDCLLRTTCHCFCQCNNNLLF